MKQDFRSRWVIYLSKVGNLIFGTGSFIIALIWYLCMVTWDAVAFRIRRLRSNQALKKIDRPQ